MTMRGSWPSTASAWGCSTPRPRRTRSISRSIRSRSSARRAFRRQRPAPRASQLTATTTAVPATARIRACASPRPPMAEYILRLKDVRGLHGEDYAYRMIAREPRPDFRLSVAPAQSECPEPADGFRSPSRRCAWMTSTVPSMWDQRPAAGLTATSGVIAARTGDHHAAAQRRGESQSSPAPSR